MCTGTVGTGYNHTLRAYTRDIIITMQAKLYFTLLYIPAYLAKS